MSVWSLGDVRNGMYGLDCGSASVQLTEQNSASRTVPTVNRFIVEVEVACTVFLVGKEAVMMKVSLFCWKRATTTGNSESRCIAWRAMISSSSFESIYEGSIESQHNS